jgi:hypothetical protein
VTETTRAGFRWPTWTKWAAAVVAVLGGGGFTALELVDDKPEPCKPMIVAGPGVLYCPHPDHVLTERHPYANVPSIACECK